MFDAESLQALRREIRRQTEQDAHLLAVLRQDARTLRGAARVIYPRTATAISVVASDGGNNWFRFDPFFLELVQVVDSYGKVLFRGVLSPTTDTDALSRLHVDGSGTPITALGRLMVDLGVRPPLLSCLSPMIPPSEKLRNDPALVSRSWVQVYRDLCEWAVLYDRICHHQFATDTLFVRDGLLRSKIFTDTYFVAMMRRISAAITQAWERDRRRIYLVGLAKYSNVLNRYQLALELEEVFPAGHPMYVPVPRAMEQRVYLWTEWARGIELLGMPGEEPRFVAGEMYFVRFGRHRGDPVWAVDLLPEQREKAQEIFGYLLSDAREGFPIAFYPRCLQRAHEFAQVVDFDQQILQDLILDEIRTLLPPEQHHLIEAFRLREDVARRRYGTP